MQYLIRLWLTLKYFILFGVLEDDSYFGNLLVFLVSLALWAALVLLALYFLSYALIPIFLVATFFYVYLYRVDKE